MIRLPAIMVYRTGSYTSDGLAVNAAGSEGVSFFDPSAKFTYRLPTEVHLGIARTSPRFEFEVDAHAFSAISPYAMLSSTQPIVTYAVAPSNGAPSVATQAFGGFTSESRGVVNVSAGGHVALTSSGIWRVHFGAETDLSPVGPADEVFTRIDLYGGTLGISGTKAGFQFSVGVNYRAGSSASISLRRLPGGDVINTSIEVRSIGLIYSLSYKF